jgi:hypothetical protein
LEQHFDFPNWTKTDISHMDTTHISRWAEANAVSLDRGYASEDREGGTPALGTDIPGVSRSDLSVFTPEHWESQNATLLYETWVQKAHDAVAQQNRLVPK